MKPIDNYSLINSENSDQTSQLAKDGQPLNLLINGRVLEAQFKSDEGHTLLWLTDDSPYDEGLHVYLLGQNDRVEDIIEAGANFAAGILKLGDYGTNWVEFTFFLNGNIYQLEIMPSARWWSPLPTGWQYKKWLRKHRLLVRLTH